MNKDRPKVYDVDSLTDEETVIFNGIIASLEQTPEFSHGYAKKKCGTCVGKGYYQTDWILEKGQYLIQDDKPVRHTKPETHICHCTKKGIIKEMRNVE